MAADGAKSDWVRVAAKGDVAEGQCLGVRIDAKEIAIYHLPGGEFYATSQRLHPRIRFAVGWLAGEWLHRMPAARRAVRLPDRQGDVGAR